MRPLYVSPPVSPTGMAVDGPGEPMPESPTPFEIGFWTPPPSLPDTEPTDIYLDPPALLDLLDIPEGSVSSGRSESVGRLEEDSTNVSADGLSYRNQGLPETLPADPNPEVRDELYEATHGTLRSNEEFLSFAMEHFFEHASVDWKLHRDHLQVLQSRCSTEPNLRHELEARKVRWLYHNSDSEVRKKVCTYLKYVAQVAGSREIPGVPSDAEWLMCKELPPDRPDIFQNIASCDISFCGFLLHCAGGQYTGLIELSDEDIGQFSAWCQLVDEDSSQSHEAA